MEVAIFWFRRDLRFEDNTALRNALDAGIPVIPLFIYDTQLISGLQENDARISFIYQRIKRLNKVLNEYNSSICTLKGNPAEIWATLIKKYKISNVYFNKDYEPYAITRDELIKNMLEKKGIKVHTYKDQVIFQENDILKNDNKPYTVFSPYKKKWLKQFHQLDFEKTTSIDFNKFADIHFPLPTLKEIGFENSDIEVRDFNLSALDNYELTRNIPSLETTFLSTHLRFGTVSIRQILTLAGNKYAVFLSELIWREFFMQIMFHFPHTVTQNFKAKYNTIEWRNNKEEFELWCLGKTGYPLVDAGMRQLNQTGFMHNRVRMVTASFLCKHLLIDWRWGETYFANKLLDYELSSNIGNWQWIAGTGCDAAPYFRIFNPEEQRKKFDKNYIYVQKWIPELNSPKYPKQIVNHQFARQRAINAYKKGVSKL
jgi:deoxyribodipyrimidine photo-lyase